MGLNWTKIKAWLRHDRISPDGKNRSVERDGEIFIAPRYPTERNLTNNPARDYGAVWSPDSRWIAFQSNRDGGDYNIWVAEERSGRITQITTVPGFERIIKWDEACNLYIDRGGSVLVVKAAELEKRLSIQ